MRTVIKSMRCITYGCGNEFDPTRFKLITNHPVMAYKPNGGLWSSPVDSQWSWKHWCEENYDWDFSTHFTFDYRGRFLVIDQEQDVRDLPLRNDGIFKLLFHYYNWEKILAAGVDAIHLTENGLLGVYDWGMALWGWDAETVLVFNPKLIVPVAKQVSA